ncbi:MAG: NUDIX hydrolase [Pseudomonadota bacterium]
MKRYGMSGPRLAVRALIRDAGRLLLVNAYSEADPKGVSDLWCAPGGGVERGASLPDNLAREVYEETGLRITVGALVGVNEFHDPKGGFHQVDLFFRATIADGIVTAAWTDPEGVVSKRRFVTEAELSTLRHKPGSLARMAFRDTGAALYDPLEPIVR